MACGPCKGEATVELFLVLLRPPLEGDPRGTARRVEGQGGGQRDGATNHASEGREEPQCPSLDA